MEFFGHTVCDSNRGAEEIFKRTQPGRKDVTKTVRDFQAGRYEQRSSAINTTEQTYNQRLAVGNRSKDSNTWINGPCHDNRNQCVPGYTGFIPGVKAENVISTTYSHSTAQSF
jgi:hypothetical protein